MKKLLSVILSAAMLLSSSTLTALSKSDTDPFENKDEVNIVYLGGSITQGAGVSDKSKCWVNRIGEYFKQKFPDKQINNYNAGLGGTGTDMGIMRLEKDVLSKNPDYVFIEFAVNDIGKSTASRHMESIIRSLQELDEVPYVTIVYTAKYNQSEKALENNSEAHQVVADYYGIPTIDMKPALEESILSTGSMEDEENVKHWLVDLTHPTEYGYDCYTQCIQSALETGDYYVRPQKQEKKLDINAAPLSTTWNDVKTVAESEGTWTSNANPSYGNGWTSSTPGDTLEYTFYGPVLGIQHRIGKESGKYTLTIDGKDVGNIDTYYSKTTSQGVLGYQNFALGSGKHTLKITVLDERNENISPDANVSVAFDYFITEKDASAYRWINENFEDCDFSRLVTSGNMTYDWTQEETAQGSNGAMKVTVSGNAAGPNFRCETVNGTTYNVSAWIKVANIDEWSLNENSDKVRFVFQAKTLNDDGSWGSNECYTECVVTDAGIISGDWVKVSAQYVCDGKGKIAGVNERVNAADVSRVEVRLGSGNLAATTGSADVPEIFYLDDFRVEPENIEPVENEDPGNIIANGKFESEEDMASWTKDGSAEISFAEGGANGTNGSALITGTESGAKSVGISQQALPIRINRAYKVSYWVKAANDAALGAFPQMIVEFKGKQTDPSSGSTTYYPNYDMGRSRANEIIGLTDEWQKIEYVFKLDGVTNDICLYPKMQIRLYDGSAVLDADHPAFYVDEVRMEELDIVYDGDFATNPAEKALNTTAKYKYPWGKYNNDQSGIEWVEGEDADGTNSYLKVTQTNTTELMTYVDLEEGASYKMTIWAKLDDWATQDTSSLTDGLYITPIFNRSRGDLSETYNSQYQYIPCAPTGETDVERWVLSDEWQKFEAEFTVAEQDSAKYRSAYMSFRLGTGKETATYSIDGVQIEKLASGSSPIPKLSDMSIKGNAVEGEPISVSVNYECSSDCDAYVFNVYAVSDDGSYAARGSEETTSNVFTYTPDSRDVGKTLRFEARAIAKNGEYSNIVTAETDKVVSNGVTPPTDEPAYETSASANFAGGWSNRLTGTIELSAGEGGQDFVYAVAVYDEDGMLIKINYKAETLLANTKKIIPVEESVSMKASSAKMFVWNSEMKPMCSAVEIQNQ